MSKSNKTTKKTILKPSNQTTLKTVKNPTEEMFWTAFEPKNQNRFICQITEAGTDNSLIPSFVIMSISRPGGTRISGEWNWSPMFIKLYDPIVPSTTQALYENFMQKNQLVDIEIKVLGPVGDVVEEWLCKKAQITSIDLDTFNWNDSGTALEITVIAKLSDVVLKY